MRHEEGQHSSGPRRMVSFSRGVIGSSLFALLLLLPLANAGFSDSTDNLANGWGSDTLDPPTAVAAVGAASVTISWTPTIDTYAEGHRVFRSTSAGGPYTQIAQTSPRGVSSYVDNTAGGPFYYVVRAYYQGWESANSNEASASAAPTDPDYDAIPTGVDNCPTTFNVNQFDTDSDGTGDACDSSPTVLTSASMIDSGQTLGTSVSNGVELADYDGDGDLDIAFSNSTANTIWFNDGAGVFTNSGQALDAAASEGSASGDFDGDGDIDIAYANNGANTVWLNNGAGVFANSGQSLGLASSNGLLTGDFDGDGTLDLVDYNKSNNTLWLNDGTGVFTDTGQFVDGRETRGGALGDVDGDFDLDVINGNKNTSNVWLGDGFGGLSDNGQSLPGADAAGLADLDGDGDRDIAFGVRGGASNTILLNNGSGTFTNTGQSLLGDAFGIALGDMDGDGDIDIAYGNNTGANTVWLNNGSATFTDSGQALDAAKTWDVAAGDVDGDGDLDLVYANDTANTVWFNTSLPFDCPVDPDLRLCVRFDAEIAGTFVDESGNNNDVANTNTSLVPGISLYAALGTPTARHEIPDSASLELTTGMTIESWLRFDSLPGAGRAGVIDNDGQYSMIYYAGSGLRCSNGLNNLPNAPVPTGVWFHAACVWDGANLTLYIDGLPQLAMASVGTMDTTNVEAISILNTSPVFDEPMDGAIDNLRIWHIGRTQAQICADAGITGC